MRDRFEIVHMRDDSSYDVLMRYAPKKSHHRWEATEQIAKVVLRGTLRRTLKAFDTHGLRYAYESIEHPEDGYVGIREKD